MLPKCAIIVVEVQMGLIRSNSRRVLIFIILIQFIVIGSFAYSENVTSITSTKNITAIIETGNSRYLLIQGLTEPKLYSVSDDVRYINHEDSNVHLFNKKREYLLTFQFDNKLSSYTEVSLDGIEYQDTNFVCKRGICLISQSNEDESKTKTQIFSVKNQEYIYLDADNL